MQVKTTVTVNDGTTATADSITAYVYDLAGNLISQTDGVGNTITFEYNAFEKVSKAVYPGDETTQAVNTIIYQYDIMGNLAKTEDSFGTINAYTHDKQGRQLSNTTKGKDNNKAIITTVQYDINGNKRYETDGNGNTKEYIYDELNRLIENRITTTNINMCHAPELSSYCSDLAHMVKYAYRLP